MEQDEVEIKKEGVQVKQEIKQEVGETTENKPEDGDKDNSDKAVIARQKERVNSSAYFLLK